MVTTQIIEDIKIKYPSSQGGGLRNQGCMSTRLSYNSDRQGKMLGCPKLEEIMILNGRNSNVCMWGKLNDLGNISCLFLFPYFGATLCFSMTKAGSIIVVRATLVAGSLVASSVIR